MQTYLVIASVLASIVAIVHSVLGEMLIYNKMREGKIVPTNGKPILKERNVRIIWATWHLVSIFGLAFSVILFRLAYPAPNLALYELIKYTAIVLISVPISLSSLLVLLATMGKHPGWIGLLGVAVPCWLALA